MSSVAMKTTRMSSVAMKTARVSSVAMKTARMSSVAMKTARIYFSFFLFCRICLFVMTQKLTYIYNILNTVIFSKSVDI